MLRHRKKQRGINHKAAVKKVGEEQSSHLRFLLCMSLWEKGGEGMGGCGPGVCLSLTVSQENYTPATCMKTEG